MDRKAIRIVIVLLAIAVLAIAFEHMGKRQQYALRHKVCTAWNPTSSATPVATPASGALGYPGDWTPVNPTCVNFVQRFYPWVISFSLIAVAVIAVAGAAWVMNDRGVLKT